jgi:hypothetical protein
MNPRASVYGKLYNGASGYSRFNLGPSTLYNSRILRIYFWNRSDSTKCENRHHLTDPDRMGYHRASCSSLSNVVLVGPAPSLNKECFGNGNRATFLGGSSAEFTHLNSIGPRPWRRRPVPGTAESGTRQSRAPVCYDTSSSWISSCLALPSTGCHPLSYRWFPWKCLPPWYRFPLHSGLPGFQRSCRP